jgi:uncharacterized membrane protein YhaH (DUF805 family)
MDFQTAVRTCLSKFVGFEGRARRSEFWWFYLACLVTLLVAAFVDGVLGGTGILYGLVALALFLPLLAAQIRRLHDTGRSGWWVLIGLIPLVGAIVLIVFLATETKPETNAWGPPAKGPALLG